MRKPLEISQAQNHSLDFGTVFRSSALFYFRKAQRFATTISFLNYWPLKRAMEVAVIVTLRDMSGLILRREKIDFTHAMVRNYRPDVPEPFEGSVEIEVFGARNLVIPYAAIMAVYETDTAISMVHSYTRAYSPHEIQEGRTITVGEESCWTIRDSAAIRSFAVTHNGFGIQPAQTAALQVLRDDGQTIVHKFEIPELGAYASHRIVPGDIIPGLSAFLDGQPANCNISFDLTGAFTRLLVGNESVDGSDIQMTHSNFNYSRHKTDKVRNGDSAALAYMPVPDGGIKGRGIVVYPDSDPGAYQMEMDGKVQEFSNGQSIRIAVPEPTVVRFRKQDGELPSRIVTAITGECSGSRLPFECSMGVVHAQYPLKRTHWAIVAADAHRSCMLIADPYEGAYGPMSDEPITARLYSARQPGFLEGRPLTGRDGAALARGLPIGELFPGAEAFLDGDFGYIMIQSGYGGLVFYTKIENPDGGTTLEHSF